MNNNFKVNRGLTLNPQTTAPVNPVSGDLYYDANANTFIFYDNGFWINLASRVDVPSATSLTSAQFTAAVVQNSLIRVTGSTLSNLYGVTASTAGKSVVIYNENTSPLIINNNSVTEPTAANRILTYNSGNVTVQAGQVVQLVYDDSQARWIIMSAPGSGSGNGFINYISNPDAEADLLGWNLYQNTAANIPSTGTGGTPTGLTFTRDTASPLRGMASFLLTQANSTNVQGEGVSTDFTIDPADEGSILAITFNYNASNTFVASNGVTAPLNDGTTTTNAGNSDVEVFIYDKTNTVLIPVTPEVIVAKGVNNFSFGGVFQTATNSTSYRLIFHVATANANATGWQFEFDNVLVGPQPFVSATSIKPTQTRLTSGSGSYSPPSGVSYIRVRMVGGGGGGAGSAGPGTGNGGGGGNTTFGTSLLVANGGGGGVVEGNDGGIGGTASLGSGPIGIALSGGNGTAGGSNGNTISQGGAGAPSPFGGAGGGMYEGAVGGIAVPNTGSGGGGNNTGSSAPGSGGGAGGYVDAMIPVPSPAYPYSVGVAGSAGAGTYPGGSGGSGIIIIDEFYISGGGTASESSGKAPTVQIFTSGTGTYTLPNGPTPLYITVEMVGGGGGGAGGGGSASTAGTGNTSTFGTSLLTANGGTGGAFNTAPGSGIGGTVTVNSPANVIKIFQGGGGSLGQGNGSAGNLSGGIGGTNPFGGAGNGTGNSGISGTGSGGGGGNCGNGSPQASGGGGGAGGYILAQINSPSASYSYSVGSGGSGTTGTTTGGNGGSGIIIVTEYYSFSGGTAFSALATSPSVHPVGAIMSAYLTETQFQAQMGTGWVLQDGRNVTGSTYAYLTGNSTIPDARGLFIRGSGTNAAQTLQNGGFPSGAALGGYQQDEFASHTHNITVNDGPVGAGNVVAESSGSGSGNTLPYALASGGSETRPVSVSANHFIKIN